MKRQSNSESLQNCESSGEACLGDPPTSVTEKKPTDVALSVRDLLKAASRGLYVYDWQFASFRGEGDAPLPLVVLSMSSLWRRRVLSLGKLSRSYVTSQEKWYTALEHIARFRSFN